MGKLFGTDGVRGVANTELSCPLTFRLGQAAAVVLTEATRHKPLFLIGKDTRISSDMLEAALIAGICSVGGDVASLGIIPTPAVAYLTRKYGADAGVVISASHNPFEHNGIKIFDSEGFKLSDALLDRIEELALDENATLPLRTGAELGRVRPMKNASDDYVKYLYSATDRIFDGVKIAVDCANGAASATAGKLFSMLGCNVVMLGCEPDGVNINENCGSTHMEALSEAVVKNRCKLGVAFDGDADRCQAVDEKGNLIDGDRLMAIFALEMQEKGELTENAFVATPMSNLGLFKMAEKHGIKVEQAAVGDRYVLELMEKKGYVLGGEQSGHMILRKYATTGDGQLTAVRLIARLVESGKKASELAGVMERYPQVMVNVTVPNGVKEAVMADAEVISVLRDGERRLDGEGRLLVRPSGTEPLIRVMAEGREFDAINTVATVAAQAIRSAAKAAAASAEQ